MRKGPTPLPVHIGMATASWPFDSGFSFDDSKDLPEELQKMLLGIQQYQTHDYRVPEMPLETVWQEGEVRLYAVPDCAYESDRSAIVLIPSLINKANILDLMPERSMLRWLVSQNVNAYLLDWGQCELDAGQANIDRLIVERLSPALSFAAQRESAPVHALGYCMGGTILLGAAKMLQQKLASVVLLAAPWDFHAGTQTLLDRVKFWAPSAFPMIEEKGVLPVDWIQTLFASVDPTAAVKKFSKFVDMDKNSDSAKLFIAVEDWLNDGVALPSDVAHFCIKDWFLENVTMKNIWIVDGDAVVPEEIDVPALIVASQKDRLVEYETAAVLHKKMKNAQILNPGCGHIGMIAGGASIDVVWTPILRWVEGRF